MGPKISNEDSRLFFHALGVNSIFSGLSGFILLAFSNPVASAIGLQNPLWLTGTGAGLLIFSALLLAHVRKGVIRKAEAIAISGMDLAWVVGSVILLVTVPGLLNSTGVWVVLAVAAVVFVIFEIQAWALWKAGVRAA